MGNPTHIVMTVGRWCEVANNPYRRGPLPHAMQARTTHLRTASPVHALVSAAQLPNGDMYKLDGHARGFLWNAGLLEQPDTVAVALYPVASMAEIEQLSHSFDNPDAVRER